MANEDFVQITWTEWINGVWIECISYYLPKIFLKVKHIKDTDKVQLDSSKLTTAYMQGSDGFVYLQIRNRRGDIELLPVYKANKEL